MNTNTPRYELIQDRRDLEPLTVRKLREILEKHEDQDAVICVDGIGKNLCIKEIGQNKAYHVFVIEVGEE